MCAHRMRHSQPAGANDCVRSFRKPTGPGTIKFAVLHPSRCQTAGSPHKWVLSRDVPCSSRRTMTNGHQVVWMCCHHKIGQLPQLRHMSVQVQKPNCPPPQRLYETVHVVPRSLAANKVSKPSLVLWTRSRCDACCISLLHTLQGHTLPLPRLPPHCVLYACCCAKLRATGGGCAHS